MFLDVFLYILSFFQIVIQKSDCYRVLAQACTASMLRKSEILVIVNSKQKSLCQLATTELFPKRQKNREAERKLQERDWVLCLRLVVLICLRLVHGSQPFKLKCKTLQISGDFIKFSECQVPLRQGNTPYWRLSSDGSNLKLTSFRATVSLRLILCSLKK